MPTVILLAEGVSSDAVYVLFPYSGVLLAHAALRDIGRTVTVTRALRFGNSAECVMLFI